MRVRAIALLPTAEITLSWSTSAARDGVEIGGIARSHRVDPVGCGEIVRAAGKRGDGVASAYGLADDLAACAARGSDHEDSHLGFSRPSGQRPAVDVEPAPL
jgi:hypothetical protein